MGSVACFSPLTDRHVVKALRALIILNSPEQLHLQPPPTPLPMGPGAYLSSALGYSSVIACMTTDMALPLYPSGLLLNAQQSTSFQLQWHLQVSYSPALPMAEWVQTCSKGSMVFVAPWQIRLHAETNWDSYSSCGFFSPTDEAGWLFKAVLTSWPYL